jgi:signal peptidase I
VHWHRQQVISVLLGAAAVIAALAVAVLLTGRAALVTTHGVSMNPTYYQGDLVLVAKADSYQLGDIAAYRLKSRVVVLHRIIDGDDSGFVFKGDNNESIDIAQPTSDQLVGKAMLLIPQGGAWLQALTNPVARFVIAVGLVIIFTTGVKKRPQRRRAPVDELAPSSGWFGGLRALPTLLRGAAAATAAAGILGLALGVLAWNPATAKPAITAVKDPSQMTFAYSAAVGRTPAYDTTEARSPDPVFRRAADKVDVHLSYLGDPGRITVDAELSTSDGWHSTMPLAKPVSVAGETYQGTVRLDLGAIEARAKAAAAVTGTPPGEVDIAVRPRVETDDSGVFQPELRLKLTPLQLSLAGGPTDLHVTESPANADVMSSRKTVELLGLGIPVLTARIVSAALLLAALLGGLFIVYVARRSTVDEPTLIRRRYASLLAPVHPTPTDGPIIDVADFATLAKLAERAAQLVLHWTRGDTATFIVADQGITYRYITFRTRSPEVPKPRRLSTAADIEGSA